MVTFRDVRKLIVRFYLERVRHCGDDLQCVFDAVESFYEQLKGMKILPLKEPVDGDDECCDVLKKTKYEEDYYIYVYGIKWDSEFCCIYDVNLLFRGIVGDTAYAPNSFMHIVARHHHAEYYDDYIRYMFRYRRFYRFIVLLYYRIMWSGEVVDEEELAEIESQTDVVRLMWPIVRRGVSSIDDLRIVAGNFDNFFVVLNDGTIIENERWVDDIFGYSYTYSMPGLYLLTHGNEWLFWKLVDIIREAKEEADEYFQSWYDYHYMRLKKAAKNYEEIKQEMDKIEEQLLREAFRVMKQIFEEQLKKLK